MNGKKALSLILCLCLVVTSFAGCGGLNNASSDLVDKSTDKAVVPVVNFVDDNDVNYETNFVSGKPTADTSTEAKPTNVDSTKVELTDKDSTKKESTVGESEKNNPVKVEGQDKNPTKEEPIKGESVKDEPTKENSSKDNLIKVEEQDKDSVKKEPVKGESVKDEPTKGNSSKDNPIKVEEQNKDSVKEEPVKGESTKDEPTKENSSKDNPVKVEEQDKDPTKEEPLKGESAKDEPTKDEPLDPIIEAIDKNLSNKEENKNTESKNDGTVNEDGELDVPFDLAYPDVFNSEDVQYADNSILVKIPAEFSEETADGLKNAGVGKMESMFAIDNYAWYTAYLRKGIDVNAAMEAVRDVTGVKVAEYNFKYETALEEGESLAEAEVIENPRYAEQWVSQKFGIKEAWGLLQEKESVGSGGGSNSVVVAVIDTGVDYNHIDLKANMWVNSKEVPDNGYDDDGNGKVDDYYGYDATANGGSGMDDHGHGTHVAGIIAASNNKEGVVGYAYNAKIMAIKAGDASGYFLQDNIAEAVIYAYENGAEVINMSFGGSASTIAVQDALAVAYSRCVLVASAGNSGAPNQGTDFYLPIPNYPAAFSYVIGVMSVGNTMVESGFTNWDVYLYNSVEYEVYAPGEQIISTIPGDKYASLSGTSMAAPVVAAHAALLRSYYDDYNKYPTKFIYGQIVCTADQVVECCNPGRHTINGMPHNLPGVINFYNSMTQLPTPDIGMSDYTLFDTETFVADKAGITKGSEEFNNGDGIIDSGEIIALGFTLKNRWGMSKNTTVHIDSTSELGGVNPYVTFLNNDINYKSVGTYSESDSGKLYSEDGEMWNGWENPFYIKISKNCPNDYTATINLTITYENGLDASDETIYQKKDTILLKIRRGTILPNRVTEDMTLTKDNYYIVPNAMLIEEGATVTVEPGTKIQFWTDDPNDSYADTAITYLNVDGKFICNGTEDEPIEIFPSGWMDEYRVEIISRDTGWVSLNYTNVTNAFVTIDEANNCVFNQNYKGTLYYRYLSNGVVQASSQKSYITITDACECSFYKIGGAYSYEEAVLSGKYNRCIFVDSSIEYASQLVAENCVFYGNNNYWNENKGAPSTITLSKFSKEISVRNIFRNNDTGTTYAVVTGNIFANIASNFANLLGGELVQFNSVDEFNYVINHLEQNQNYLCGFEIKDKIPYNLDGSKMSIGEEQYTMNKRTMRYGVAAYGDKNIGLYDTNYNEYTVWAAIVEIPGPVYITNIELEDYLVDLDSEMTYQINATLTPETADNTTLKYESQDMNVVTVDATGKVTPVGIGTTTVRVYSPDYAVYNYVTINVREIVDLDSFEFEKEDITLDIGTTKKVNVAYYPTNTTKKGLNYISSNEDVATISASGIITAKAVGQTVITATAYNGLTSTLTVNVVIPATSINFEEEMYVTDFDKEDGTSFYPTILPAETTDKSLIWESSNPEICYVDEEGKLVKLEEGTAVLKATLNNTSLSDTLVVKVKAEGATVEVVKIKRDFTHTFALLDDGSLWVWGSYHQTPKKVNITNIKDFNVTSGTVYILDNEGTVKRYSTKYAADESQRDYATLHLDDYQNTDMLANIVSLSSEIKQTYGNFAYFAITEEGAVWAWGINNYGQLGDGTTAKRDKPVLLNIPEPIEKVYYSYGQTTVFLSTTGNIYIAGNSKASEPVKQYENVCDINVVSDVLFIDYGDYVDIVRLTTNFEVYYTYYKEKENENVTDQSTYIENGIVYGKYVYAFWSNSAFQNTDWFALEKVDNATKVFDLSNNLYIQTSDGKLYSIGSGMDYALGTGSTTDTMVPMQVHFNVKETDVVLTLQEWNGIEVEEDTFTLDDDVIELDFSNGITNSDEYGYIVLKDSQDKAVTFSKNIDLDKLTLSPHASLTNGESYTLTIPAGALKAVNSESINEEIILTFTYTGTEIDDKVVVEETKNEAIADQDKLDQRHFWTSDEILGYWNEFVADGYDTKIHSSAILNRLNDDNVSTWLRFTAPSGSTDSAISLGGNYWGTTNKELINKQILDFDDYMSLVDINEGEILTEAPSNTFPFVVDAYLELDGERVDTVGNDLVTFVVEFNRDMDTTIPLEVKFGSAYPYADYIVEGEYESPRVWKGEMQLTTIIENGYQYWTVTNGKAAGTSLKLYTDWGRFPFKIDTTAAQALIMQAEVTNKGIKLTWEQDDFDTLAGYNVYRSTEEDGLYTKINRTVIPAETKEWFDDTVIPGQKYYYNFTVVQSDMTESEPSGKVQATAMDTMAPDIYHSPVYHAFTGSNLVISATVTDNIGITGAKLYYRTTGTEEWKTKQMTNNNDKYSAIIPANDITTEGLEYYIEATDGISNTYKASAEEPYSITVQVAVTANQKGDVNGDGAVSLQDAMMLLYSINDKYNMNEEEFARADLDDNGVLEAKEALRILQYVNGTVGSVLP